jgi:hypothetical protein
MHCIAWHVAVILHAGYLRSEAGRAARARESCEHVPMGPGADADAPLENAPEEPEDAQGAGDAGDTDDAEDDGGGEASGTFDRWRRESALGNVGTGVARGLQAVFAPHVDQIVIMASVPGDPPDADDRVHVILDPDDPTKSIAIVPDPKPDPSVG